MFGNIDLKIKKIIKLKKKTYMYVPIKVSNMPPDQWIVFALELGQICLIKAVIEIFS